ncbi:hypothetical protein G6F61_014573 [Rhizopus arrhizus]|nr:hypothetical protein G6F61_014573 [Rhizopus arrhizus]
MALAVVRRDRELRHEQLGLVGQVERRGQRDHLGLFRNAVVDRQRLEIAAAGQRRRSHHHRIHFVPQQLAQHVRSRHRRAVQHQVAVAGGGDPARHAQRVVRRAWAQRVQPDRDSARAAHADPVRRPPDPHFHRHRPRGHP